jgi:hypothetical protein
MVAGSRETYCLHRSTVNSERVELIMLEAWFGNACRVCPEAPRAISAYLLAILSTRVRLYCVWLVGE